jgi:hypothetical protein
MVIFYKIKDPPPHHKQERKSIGITRKKKYWDEIKVEFMKNNQKIGGRTNLPGAGRERTTSNTCKLSTERK